MERIKEGDIMDRIVTARDITPENFFDEFMTYTRQEREVMAVKLMREYNRLLDVRDLQWDDPFLRAAWTVALSCMEGVLDPMHLPVEKRFKYRIE